MSLKLVIFDMDGVLVDACGWHKDALNEALEEICGYVIPDQEHYSTFNGLPTRTKLHKLTEMGIIAADRHELVSELKQEKTIDIIEKRARRDESKIELIRWLKDKEIITACFTNSISKTAILMLKKVGAHDLLDCLVTNQDVQNPKPDPEGYLKILEIFNCSAGNTMIVEDSPKGLTAAYASGCSVMEVKNSKQVTKNTVEDYINENFNSHGG
jgi:HAD superfamily hydrolase (TIGR01509 family)